MAVFTVGLAATFAVSHWIAADQQQQERQRQERVGRAVVESVRIALARVESRVNTVAGFMGFAEDVSQEELERFVDAIGLLEGLGGFGYAPLVDAADLGDYMARIRESAPGYEVFAVAADGSHVPVAPEAEHAPLETFAPPEAFGVPPRGLDVMSEPARREAAEIAMRTGELVATPFLTLLGQPDPDGLVVFSPVVGPDGAVWGIVTAPVDLSLLLESQIPEGLQSPLVWQLIDLADLQTVGSAVEADKRVVEDQVAFGGRVWRIEVASTGPVAAVIPLFGSWLNLPVGVAGSVITALLVGLWIQRVQVRRERRRRIADATAKDRFLASVSHELRTPLTAVIGFLDEATHPENLTHMSQREMLHIASDQAREVARIVEDLVVVARIDEPLPAAKGSVFDLSGEVAQVIAGLPEGVQAQIRCQGKAQVWADSARTRQILRNLIDNAVKHGSPPIGISIQAGPTHAQLRASDHGPGIPPQHREKIFEPYATFHQSQTLPDSLGLGLWLSRRLARAMDGDLTYHHSDSGPTFTLTLPTREPTAKARARRLLQTRRTLAPAPSGAAKPHAAGAGPDDREPSLASK
ncbi:MAG: ATP-binding protein [Actinomycetota bacterium]